jgi:hypothetical protein
MAIKIKRSSGNLAPTELAAGQLAYSEGSSNGGTLYYGEIGGTVREIGGRKIVDKVNGIEAGAQVNTVTSVAGRTGAVTIATTDVSGFNTAVDARITSTKLTTELGYTPENAANKGQANGYASLDGSGLVPSSQLPSYVDDVLEYANSTSFPSTGQSTGKIYVAIDTGKTWRWSGSAYIEISASPGSTDSVTEGSTNLYFTNARARSAISASQNLSYNESTGALQGPDLSTYATGSQLTTLANSLSAVATTGTFASLTSKPTTISGYGITDAFSGSYTDLTSKPTLFSGSYSDLTNKPSLFSGSFADLSNKPTTISGYGITDAFSGSYNDLSNKPTLFTEVVEDTTPQLGGNLDVNAKDITSVSNGNIVIAPNGSGSIVLNKDGTGVTFARRTASTGIASNTLVAQRNYTADVLANMDGHMAAIAYGVRDSALATSTFARAGGEYATNGDHSFAVEFSSNNFTSQTRALTVAQNAMVVGPESGTTQQNISSLAVQNLVLGTNWLNEGLGGSITIVAGANGNVEIAPNGTGKVKLSGLSYPNSDGTANQVLVTNGSGVLSWATQSGGLSDIVNDTTPQLGGNLDVQSNSITTSVTNGNIVIAPNGTGDVQLDADTVRIGDSGSEAILTTNGTGGLRISTNDNSTTGYIAINSGAGGHITLEPEGTGQVFVNASTLRVGDANAQATVTSNGTGNLVLSTNQGTNSGSITINQGTNGNIQITPNGTGGIVLSGNTTAAMTAIANSSPMVGRHIVTASASDNNFSFSGQKHRTDIAFSSMTDEPVVYAFAVRDNTNTNRSFGRWIGRYLGSSSNPVFTLRGSPDGFTTNLHYMTLGGAVGTFGSTSSAYTITSNTGGNLVLTANNNADSGTITIASGANGNITLTPNGTGNIVLEGLNWPQADGTAGQLLKTNGSGQLSFTSDIDDGTF